MLLTTTSHLQDKQIQYLGLVTGEAILGANIFRDFFASITDIVGGRSAYETVGANGGMMMVSASGTAVVVR